MKKKILCIVIAVLLSAFSFAGCSGSKNTADSSKLNIVTTVFPVYDWVRNIAGDTEDVDITMLLDKGVDLHSFQPTADDLVKISTCDVFIYVGGESDGWVDDALKDIQNKDVVIVDLMDSLGAALAEEVEGIESAGEEEGEEEEVEYDEHIWLSLRNASALSDVICNALCKADDKNAASYKENAKNYKAKLDALDAEYSDTLQNCKNDTLVFGDRFPFVYLMNDYNLNYFAAFSGCSTETNASFETVITLAEKVDELKLGYVMALEGSDHSTAEKIADNCKAKGIEILSLNSLQSVTGKDVETGCDYVEVMKNNLEIIKKALG